MAEPQHRSASPSDALMGISTANAIVIFVLIICAAGLGIGFMTPIAAVLAVLIGMVGLNALDAPVTLHSFAPIAIRIALALLGPGAYSLEARVFGRRLMEFGPRADDDN